jgi:hypothetical protein
MASSLLDRVKRQPQSAETFIAAADAVPNNAAPTTAPTATSTDAPLITGDPVAAISPAPMTPARSSPASRARHAPTEDPRKHDVPRYTFNLRLNEYELELLRSLADEQRESMQKILKNGLIPYLENLRKTNRKTGSQ